MRRPPEVSCRPVLGWARLEEADRNFERAAELLDRAEKVAPNNPSVMLSRAVLCGRTGSYSQALAILDVMAPTKNGAGLGANELLEKGRLLDRIGRYDEAFAAFAEGKRLCREVTGLNYLEEQAQQLTGRLKGFFTESRLADPAARPAAGRHGAADLHTRLPALGDDAGRADPIGASAHLLPATNCPSSMRSPMRWCGC